MYKTLEDIKRVIALNKPEIVVDMFITSYLTGEALQPYFDIEERYEELKLTPEQDTKEAVIGEKGEVISEEIDYNALRDNEINQLELENTYLIEPEQTYHKGYIMVWDEELEQEVEEVVDVADIMPYLNERRPSPIINVNKFKTVDLIDTLQQKELDQLEKINKSTLRILISLVQVLLEKEVITPTAFTVEERQLYLKTLNLKKLIY